LNWRNDYPLARVKLKHAKSPRRHTRRCQ
jgi:hypothetical protein